MRPIVEISTGKLEGIAENGLHIFRGVPYARPPIGPRRFRPPDAPEPWSGIRDAGTFSATAPQPPDMLSMLLGFNAQPTEEDCLTINVWAPSAPAAPRPVLVWIHGGAFVVGSGSRRISDGAELARRGDVVVVSLNYRLGALGFLDLREHGGDAIGATPNVGLHDQIAALAWVRREIAGFGGDPDNVTIFGESAGAISVGMLLASPLARGLFRRAILQSGGPNFVSTPAQAAEVSEAVLNNLELRPGDLAALYELPTERILEAQLRVLIAPPKAVGGLAFQPAIDGAVLPDHPLALLADGAARATPTIIGTTLDEMKLFDLMEPAVRELDDAKLLRACERTIGAERARDAIALYREMRSARGAAADPPSLWRAIETDRLFRAPAQRLAALQAGHGAPTWAYLFTWVSPHLGGVLGACHAIDVPFVFGSHDHELVAPFTGGGAAATALSHSVRDAWCAFARAGDPSHSGLPRWPRYELPRRATMLLGPECGIVDAPYESERAFWD